MNPFLITLLRRRIFRLVTSAAAATGIVFSFLCAPRPVRADGPYTLTLYVDEGKGSFVGHVFVSLSDGNRTDFSGFYSIVPDLAPAKMGGGLVKDDKTHPYDVSKTYSITHKQYMNSQQAINEWLREDRAWWFNHHCGDFAETVATAAGISIDLPWTATGRNRPAIFGRYLESIGGEKHDSSSAHSSNASKSTKLHWLGKWTMAAVTGAPAKSVGIEITQTSNGSDGKPPRFWARSSSLFYSFKVESAENNGGTWVLHCVSSTGSHRFDLTGDDGLTGQATDEFNNVVRSGSVDLKRTDAMPSW